MSRIREAEEAFKLLSAPFTFDELDIKAQSVSKTTDKALAAPYFSSRLVMKRLDEAVYPENWRESYEALSITLASGSKSAIHGGFKCRIGVRVLIDGKEEWIERENAAQCTDFEAVKGGISDSFKRTFSNLGCRHLYNIRLGWFPCEKYEGKFSKWKPQSLKDMRKTYENALKGIMPEVAEQIDEPAAGAKAAARPEAEPLPDSFYKFPETFPDSAPGRFLNQIMHMGLPNPATGGRALALYTPVVQKFLRAPGLAMEKVTPAQYAELHAWMVKIAQGTMKMPAVLKPYQRAQEAAK